MLLLSPLSWPDYFITFISSNYSILIKENVRTTLYVTCFSAIQSYYFIFNVNFIFCIHFHFHFHYYFLRFSPDGYSHRFWYWNALRNVSRNIPQSLTPYYSLYHDSHDHDRHLHQIVLIDISFLPLTSLASSLSRSLSLPVDSCPTFSLSSFSFLLFFLSSLSSISSPPSSPILLPFLFSSSSSLVSYLPKYFYFLFSSIYWPVNSNRR